jgi:hypothetical protein
MDAATEAIEVRRCDVRVIYATLPPEVAGAAAILNHGAAARKPSIVEEFAEPY